MHKLILLSALALVWPGRPGHAAGLPGKLIFSSTTLTQIVQLDLGSSRMSPLKVNAARLAVSPDGRKMAYIDSRDRLHVFDLSSGADSLFPEGRWSYYSPTFAGNDTLAYIKGSWDLAIYTVPVNRPSGEHKWAGKLPPFDLVQYMQIAWIPGSGDQTPAFVMQGKDGLYVLSSGAARKLAAGERGATLRYPAVSPDGKRAAYVSDGVNSEICVVDIAGGTPRVVRKDASDPEWSPDGRFIAFTSTSAVSRGLEVRDAVTGQGLGRTAGFFLHGLAAMRADGSGAASITTPDGKPVNVHSNIVWR